jgi:hypothetical protein
MLTAALHFNPMFLYIGSGIAGVVAVGRFMLAWAVDFS